MFGEIHDNEDVTGKKWIHGVPQSAGVSNGTPQSRQEISETQSMQIELRSVLLVVSSARATEPGARLALIPGFAGQRFILRESYARFDCATGVHDTFVMLHPWRFTIVIVSQNPMIIHATTMMMWGSNSRHLAMLLSKDCCSLVGVGVAIAARRAACRTLAHRNSPAETALRSGLPAR